jgi:glutaredoxin
MITVYTKDNCRFCDLAESLLDSKNIPYRSYKIGKDVSRQWIVESFPNFKTAPIIVDGERLIGGYDRLLSEVSDPNNQLGKTFLQE